MTGISKELQEEYAMRFARNEEYRKSVWEILVRSYFQKAIGKNKRILDLGCGWGEFINNIEAGTKYAMDLNPDARLRVADDVIFLQQDCSVRWEMPDCSLDIIFTSNFFEHLPSKKNLTDLLRQAWRCLRPGGRLICLGPNIKYVGGAYWDFYDHYLPLTDLSLVEGLKLSHFKIVSVIPRFLPYTMAHGRRFPLWILRLYMRIPILWTLFGKQFLITAMKGESFQVSDLSAS